MSDFVDALVDLLPEHNSLKSKRNPLRQVLDKSVGEWFDNHSVQTFYDNLFLNSATGGWLDLHGRDYGVYRRIGESDEDYRRRIVFEKLDYLTTELLLTVYGVGLFSYRMDFDLTGNTLVSDNPYISQNFIGVSDEETIRILDSKYIIGTGVTWVNSDGEIEYILNTRGINILSNYSKIYTLTDLNNYFKWNATIMKVKLVLLNATSCDTMFYGCSNLVSVDLDLPNATECRDLLRYCSSLTSLNLNLPNATDCMNMLWECSSLTSIDLDLPNATNCNAMLLKCSSLTNINLNLPNAIDCTQMMLNCSSLTSIDLNLPNATKCSFMLFGCSSLESVKLKLPELTEYTDIFYQCSNIETIDVTIPSSIVNDFKSYVTGLNLQHLTSFKINGEEQL